MYKISNFLIFNYFIRKYEKDIIRKVAQLLAGYLRSNNVKTLLIRRNPEYDIEGREDFTVMIRGSDGKIERKIGNLIIVNTPHYNNIVYQGIVPGYVNPFTDDGGVALQYTNSVRKDFNDVPFP